VSFLNTAIWPLLALGGVPLIIHLLTRRPPRPMEFAPIGLLRRALRRQERRMRLRRWLLLALRTAWVLCLLLAVLQPQWGRPAAAVDGDRSSLAILLDSSGSMDTKGSDGERFYDRALAMGQAQADRRPISLSHCTAQGLKTLVAEPRSGVNLRAELGDYQPLGGVSLSACAAGLPESALVLTDGWSGFAGDVPVQIVAEPGEGVANWGFGEVTLSRRGGNSYKLRVEVVGQPGQRRIEALINGDARAATRVTLPASGRAFAQLTLGLKPGRYVLELRLPADTREADNRRHLVLHASGPTRLLAVNGDARDSAYADELYYIQQAERALDHHDPFTLEAVVAGEEHRAPLQDSDVVLIANVAKLDPGFSQALASFVRGGGGLLISVGANTDALELQRSLGSLLPVQVRARWAAKDAEGNPSKSAALQASAPQSEWLKTIGLEAGGGLLRTRIWQGLNVDASKGVKWRLSDGRPLWIERSFGEGRVALLTTSIDRDHADLAIRPGFVPMLRGALRALAGDQASQLSPSVLPGQVWRHPLEIDDSVFRRVGGGVIRAQVLDDQLELEPSALGLWQQRDQGLAVELRTDPLESQPHTQAGESRAVQAGIGQDHVPLWPWLLLFGMLFLAAESLVLLSDHQARAA
jgi:hypothetical protein